MKTKKIDCVSEKNRIIREKSGVLYSFLVDRNDGNYSGLELELKAFIIDVNKYDILTVPIPDKKHKDDLDNFSKKFSDIKSELFIYFNLYNKLVSHYTDEGYSYMKISFVELKANHFQVSDLSDTDSTILNSFIGKLYGILTFTKLDKVTMDSYLLFNLRSEYLINVDLVDLGNKFVDSSLGQALKNASNDKYVPYSIIYDLNKVKDYVERIDNYLAGCLGKDIFKIQFDFCFGSKEKLPSSIPVDSFYLSSIPIDVNNVRLEKEFPYYDQGSLEP